MTTKASDDLAAAYRHLTSGVEEPDFGWITPAAMELLLRAEGWKEAKIKRYLTGLRKALKRGQGFTHPKDFK